MGRKKNRNLKHRICAITYHKRGVGHFLACICKSMREVCIILNQDRDCQTR